MDETATYSPRLHAEVIELMQKTAALELPMTGECSAEELRAASIKRGLTIRPVVEPVGKVIQRTVQTGTAEIPIRIYQPDSAKLPTPLVMVFHGGGWVVGNTDSEDVTSRGMCRRLNATVISVDYRLAPENRFPKAAEDCYAATEWAVQNADSLGADARLIALTGTSAGGNLAAAVAIMSRDRRGPEISHQALFCPVIDFDFDRPSYDEFADGFGLTATGMRWFWDQYLGPDGNGFHPYVSPIRAESLSELPDATIIVAECDVLRDEAEDYASALSKADVDVRLTRYEGMIHGFNLQLGLIQAAETALDEVADRISGSFSRIANQ